MIPLVWEILSSRSTQEDSSWKWPGTRAKRNLDKNIYYRPGFRGWLKEQDLGNSQDMEDEGREMVDHE